MTLEQAYFITQIGAGIVLIISIIFLALQVRQNSKILERTMGEDYRMSELFTSEEIVKNRNFAEFHMKIGTEYDALDAIDKYRADWLAQKNMRVLIQSTVAHIAGTLSYEDWQEVQMRISMAAKRQNIQTVWERIKKNYPKNVQDLWEKAANS